MSRPPPPNHQYSFDHHDDHAMNSHPQDHYGQPSQPYRDIQSSSPAPNYMPYDANRTVSPPQPPVHRRPLAGSNGYTQNQGAYPGQETYHHDTGNPFQNPSPPQQHAQALGYTQSMRTTSTTTPGMDNLGHAAAGGGIAGIALGVANTNERDSGVQAMRGMPNPSQSSYDDDRYERNYQPIGSDTPYIPDPPQRRDLHETGSYSSTAALGAGGAGTGWATPQSYHPSEQHIPLNSNHSDEAIYGAQRAFGDTQNKRYSSPWDPGMDPTAFHPDDIEDDGDDGMGYNKSNPKRNSMLGFGQKSQSSLNKAGAAGAVAAPLNGHYAPTSYEKSGLRAEEKASRKKKKTILIVLGAILLLAIIGGAITAGILASRKSQNSSGQSAAEDDGKGDLDKNSGEIKALMNNANLHRVFPGVAYTPFNGQYPECITNPPSQNNITRDVAVLSQLTKVIRLYGTDCDQTDMVLHAIDKLGLTDMKVWMAVWLDNNSTTNARGMRDMYDILKRKGADPFAGVVVGNEVLFREQMTMSQLGNLAAGVKSNLTSQGINLPVAIADLGDNWKADLVSKVDVVMSNIHPFFGGTAANEAADWTKNFWTTHDVVLTKGTNKKNIISEVGWPSGGGNKCGAAQCTSDTQGSVAGIDELNTFMSDFVCQSLEEGTDFIWFEAFDEPWKKRFNNGTEQWEDKWGVMDAGRNLKDGVKIPDCGGKTV